jgi:hypothetical protein
MRSLPRVPYHFFIEHFHGEGAPVLGAGRFGGQ